MAYDETVSDRIRAALQRRRGITEKKMFGGIAFMARGHMFCGVVASDLMLRLGEDGAAEALTTDAHTRPMDFTGKPLKTMIYVKPPGFADEEDLAAWVERGLAFVRTLPPKP